MTRPYRFDDALETKKRKRLHPIWRGIGFLIMVALTVGGFWLAGYVLELHWADPFLPFRVPRNFVVTFHEALPTMPGKLAVQIGTTILIDLIGFALMVLLYGVINPLRPGETDAPQPRGRGRTSRVR